MPVPPKKCFSTWFQKETKFSRNLCNLSVCCSPETLPVQASSKSWSDFSSTWTHREVSDVLDFYKFNENCHLVWEERLRLVVSVGKKALSSLWQAAPWTSSQSPARHPCNFGWRIRICISRPVSVQTASVLKGAWKELGRISLALSAVQGEALGEMIVGHVQKRAE